MRGNLPGTPSTRDPPETDVPIGINVMAKDPVLHGDGAKEPQDLPKMPTTAMMKLTLETDAPAVHQIPIGLTETTIVTETEPVLNGDGAKEPQDDRESNILSKFYL